MSNLFFVVSSYLSILTGAISILTLLFTLIVHHRFKKEMLAATREKDFEMAISSYDLTTIGGYLYKNLGPFNLADYGTDTRIRRRLNKIIEKFNEFLGEPEEVASPPRREFGETQFIPRAASELLAAKSEIQNGRIW